MKRINNENKKAFKRGLFLMQEIDLNNQKICKNIFQKIDTK